jgi:hypothetical protein
MFKLYSYYNKFHVITKDCNLPKDYEVAWEIGMKLGEYRQILVNQFGGNKTYITEDLDVKGNNIYFKSEEQATNVLHWLDSILVADRLRGKKKGFDDYVLKHLEEQLLAGLGIPKRYLGESYGESMLGCDLDKFLPNKNRRVYANIGRER